MLEAVKALREVNSALFAILTRMQELARTLPEYPTVRAMGGVGDILSVKLIAEIGDIRRFHSSKGLIAYAGIDPPPYESGKLIGTNRHITKRGSATLRKIGYEVMRCVKAGGRRALWKALRGTLWKVLRRALRRTLWSWARSEILYRNFKSSDFTYKRSR